MTIIEVRGDDGKLIELVQVSLSQASHRIMLTDDQGHQVFIHHAAWMDIMKVVSTLLMEEERKANTQEKR